MPINNQFFYFRRPLIKGNIVFMLVSALTVNNVQHYNDINRAHKTNISFPAITMKYKFNYKIKALINTHLL